MPSTVPTVSFQVFRTAHGDQRTGEWREAGWKGILAKQKKIMSK